MQTQDFTEEEINKIMDEVDINQSGQLEYSEFLTAVI